MVNFSEPILVNGSEPIDTRFDWTKSCAYDEDQKRHFHAEAKKRLKTLAGTLGFSPESYDRISELEYFRGAFGLGIERDRHFEAKAPISRYIEAAGKAGHITEEVTPASSITGTSRCATGHTHFSDHDQLRSEALLKKYRSELPVRARNIFLQSLTRIDRYLSGRMSLRDVSSTGILPARPEQKALPETPCLQLR